MTIEKQVPEETSSTSGCQVPSIRELRQRSLDEIVYQPECDHTERQAMDMEVECEEPEEDMLQLRSHLHHHHRHHHSIYSRNHSYLHRVSTDGGSVCPHHPSSCTMLMACRDTVSPKRRNSRLMSITPPPPTSMSVGTSVSAKSPRISSVSSSDRDSFAFDRVDALPKDMSFTWLDILAIVFSIGTFLADIGTDMVVALFHLHNQDYWYFGLTAAFIVIPTLIVTGISLRWYVLDAREEPTQPISTWKWIVRTIFLLLQLGPIIRYLDSLMYGLKFRKSVKLRNRSEQKKYFQYMVYEDTDATMLRLFECFMEAAPQLVLQIYIMVKKSRFYHQIPLSEQAYSSALNETVTSFLGQVGKTTDSTQFPPLISPNEPWFVLAQLAAVFASMVSLSWSLVSYHRALRMSLPDKVNMTWPGLMVQFLWRICMIGSRVLVLALFATTYTRSIGFVCIIHWIIMFLWIISMRTSFCDNKIEELGYNAVLAVMYIFCYFNPVDSPTRFRYLTFYVFMFFENSILMFLFYSSRSFQPLFARLIVGTHFSAFVTGLCVMVIYYLYFHPTGAIRVWRRRTPDAGSDTVDLRSEENGRKAKKQISSSIWINQGRVLHPRPAIPNISTNQSTSTPGNSSLGGDVVVKNKIPNLVKELRLPPLSD